MNDFWLDKLPMSLAKLFEGLDEASGSDGNSYMSLPLAAIIHILFPKNNGLVMGASMEDVFRYFEDYRFELALEALRRRTSVQAGPATIESIFTNRKFCINGYIKALGL